MVFARVFFSLPSSDEAELSSVLGEPKFTKEKWKETRAEKRKLSAVVCCTGASHHEANTSKDIGLVWGVCRKCKCGWKDGGGGYDRRGEGHIRWFDK